MHKFKAGDLCFRKSDIVQIGQIVREVDLSGNIRIDYAYPPKFHLAADFDNSPRGSVVQIHSGEIGEPTKYIPTGIKHDQDKPDMSLLSSVALVEVAKVMTFGKKKYAAHNWRGGFAWTRPLSAGMRHLVAFIGGEDNDPETGLSHLAHAICCCMFVLEFTRTKAGTDDRYKVEVKDATQGS